MLRNESVIILNVSDTFSKTSINFVDNLYMYFN